MYHPSRGGVRGGRDQFSWDDVKADKHRENYLGHSIKAPVGRWQKGKDLHWYARDKNGNELTEDAKKEEIKRIKEEEEQAIREALGLAPKCNNRPQGNRLDKREVAELLKKGSSADDTVTGYVDGERVQGLGYSQAPHHHTYDDQRKKKKPETYSIPREEEINQHSDEEKSDTLKEEKELKSERKEDKKRRKEEKKSSKSDKKRSEADSGRHKKRHHSEHHTKKHRRRHDSDIE